MSELKLSVAGWGVVAVDKRELRKLMRAAGNDIRGKTSRPSISATAAARRHTVRGTLCTSTPAHRRSASRAICGPALKTYVYKSAEGFAVRARQFYALFLETGAFGGAAPPCRLPRASPLGRSTVRAQRAKARGERREMEPRPFSIASWGERAPELNRRVGIALQNSLTWKETKP